MQSEIRDSKAIPAITVSQSNSTNRLLGTNPADFP